MTHALLADLLACHPSPAAAARAAAQAGVPMPDLGPVVAATDLAAARAAVAALLSSDDLGRGFLIATVLGVGENQAKEFLDRARAAGVRLDPDAVNGCVAVRDALDPARVRDRLAPLLGVAAAAGPRYDAAHRPHFLRWLRGIGGGVHEKVQGVLFECGFPRGHVQTALPPYNYWDKVFEEIDGGAGGPRDEFLAGFFVAVADSYPVLKCDPAKW